MVELILNQNSCKSIDDFVAEEMLMVLDSYGMSHTTDSTHMLSKCNNLCRESCIQALWRWYTKRCRSAFHSQTVEFYFCKFFFRRRSWNFGFSAKVCDWKAHRASRAAAKNRRSVGFGPGAQTCVAPPACFAWNSPFVWSARYSCLPHCRFCEEKKNFTCCLWRILQFAFQYFALHSKLYISMDFSRSASLV